MKSLSQHIKEEFNFRINRDSAKITYNYSPKIKDELKQIIKDHYDAAVYDLNDIDVSQIMDFSELFLNDPNTGNPQFDVSKWNVSNGKTFTKMFYNCDNFNGDLSKWDVSNAVDLSYIFYSCEEFNCDLSRWDVSNCSDFAGIFCKCTNFNCDLSQWDVSKGKHFSNMFCRCTNFNSDLSNWDVSNGINFASMFYKCPIKQEFKPTYHPGM